MRSICLSSPSITALRAASSRTWLGESGDCCAMTLTGRANEVAKTRLSRIDWTLIVKPFLSEGEKSKRGGSASLTRRCWQAAEIGEGHTDQLRFQSRIFDRHGAG